MAAQIVSQPTYPLEEHSSFAELGVVYGEKAVAEAQARLRVVLQFKSLQPKTVRLGRCRVLSPAVDQLAERAGVSIGTLWRWSRLYRSAYEAAHGNVHVKGRWCTNRS